MVVLVAAAGVYCTRLGLLRAAYARVGLDWVAVAEDGRRCSVLLHGLAGGARVGWACAMLLSAWRPLCSRAAAPAALPGCKLGLSAL